MRALLFIATGQQLSMEGVLEAQIQGGCHSAKLQCSVPMFNCRLDGEQTSLMRLPVIKLVEKLKNC